MLEWKKHDFVKMQAGWLSDDVMHSFFTRCCNNTNGLYSFFDPLFFTRLDTSHGVERVSTWYKNEIEAFFQEKTTIFIPVNVDGRHWGLATIRVEHKNVKVKYYDPAGGSNRGEVRVFPKLEAYITHQAKLKGIQGTSGMHPLPNISSVSMGS